MGNENNINKIPNESLGKIGGGANNTGNADDLRVRNDVLAFVAKASNGDIITACRACGGFIPPDSQVHECKCNGVLYYIYRLSPDRNIWRRD